MSNDIQLGAKSHPERCVIAHPFNPPHLIPLTEIVGGAKTSEETIRRASRMPYLNRAADSAGQQGNAGACIANRLRAAFGARGLLPRCRRRHPSAADVAHRPVLGARSALGRHGQHDAQPRLGGGPGGASGTSHQQFAGPMTAWWKTLGAPRCWPPEVRRSLSTAMAMPRSDRAPSRSWRRSGTRFCWGSSSCAPKVRRPLLHPKLRLALPEAARSESIFRRGRR